MVRERGRVLHGKKQAVVKEIGLESRMGRMQACAGLWGIRSDLGARVRDLCVSAVLRHVCARCVAHHATRTGAAQLPSTIVDLQLPDDLVLVHHDDVAKKHRGHSGRRRPSARSPQCDRLARKSPPSSCTAKPVERRDGRPTPTFLPSFLPSFLPYIKPLR